MSIILHLQTKVQFTMYVWDRKMRVPGRSESSVDKVKHRGCCECPLRGT